jgi:hypothetical protein
MRVRDPPLCELTLMLKLETNIARLIYFMCEFLTHLTMIKSHAGSI